MSIANEITNYANGLSDAYDAVNDMSGIIPQDKNMNNLDTAIRTIPQSAGPTYTAGNGIVIDANDEISIDDTVVAELSDIGNGTLTIKRNGTTDQTFTANSSTNVTVDVQAPVRVDLKGQCQTTGYVRSVIALCKVNTSDQTVINSFSSGRLSFHRDNGAAVDSYIDFVIGGKYATAYTYYFSYSSNLALIGETADIDTSLGFRPCIFKYDNVWYAGIEYHAQNAQQPYVAFNGEKVGIDIFALDYYKVSYTSGGTTVPGEVLNQEVYDSLDYTKTDWTKGALRARYLITENGTIKKGDNYTATLPNKTGTLALTSDIPTKTSDLTNDGSDNTSTYVEADDNQKLTLQNGTVIPGFDSMTPVKTFTWTIDDTTYRPIYEIPNTGWDYTNMDIVVAYRITVTGTGIKQVCDVIDHWHAPTVYPVSEVLNRTLSTSAATTGIRYLRSVNPTATYVNNTTYKMGMEITAYDSTSRTVQVEVLLDNSNVTWNETKPVGTIYVSDTYHSANNLQSYSTRGWLSRKPQSLVATSADSAGFITGSEPYSMNTSVLKSGEALVRNTIGFLADDGKVYRINNSVKNMVCNDSGRIGHISSAYNADTTIDYRYFRSLAQLSSTVMGTTSYSTLTVGYPVYLRCTMDANGKIHADDYISTTMSAGYTWVPIGFATASNAVAMDARKPMFYTLDANGKLTHINGMEVPGSGGGSTYTAGNGINIDANNEISIDTTVVAEVSNVPVITMTSTDPGEGQPLAPNNFIAVYNV